MQSSHNLHPCYLRIKHCIIFRLKYNGIFQSHWHSWGVTLQGHLRRIKWIKCQTRRQNPVNLHEVGLKSVIIEVLSKILFFRPFHHESLLPPMPVEFPCCRKGKHKSNYLSSLLEEPS